MGTNIEAKIERSIIFPSNDSATCSIAHKSRRSLNRCRGAYRNAISTPLDNTHSIDPLRIDVRSPTSRIYPSNDHSASTITYKLRIILFIPSCADGGSVGTPYNVLGHERDSFLSFPKSIICLCEYFLLVYCVI
ncbi:MAG: hypothetical protein RBG13Loki_0588 [Promethearchaeota archaeon CR_4]|nr:MAG: hypothetical protein RBG13Loki_0588 [Candidatus Lokiarchaeota archaeon CR_4]